MVYIVSMIKKIEVKEFSTFWSVKIWEVPSSRPSIIGLAPRVRVAGIDKQGRSPHLARILAEEEAIQHSQTFDKVELVQV
jgi:hypothetical protein